LIGFMKIDSFSNPSQIAGAYRSPASAPAARVAPTSLDHTAGRIDRINQAERALNSRAMKLVAAVVPGQVDFSAADAAPVTAPKPLYRHPADRNTAATAIITGRRLDVTG
jgi:hypothetical protein